MDWTWGWSAVGAIATCILAAGIFFAVLQVKQARRSTNAQVAMDLFRELRDYRTIEKLRTIYALNSEDFENLQGNKKKEIDYVLNRFDMLGALVTNRIIDEQLAIEAFAGFPALRCWYKLGEHYVKKEQEKRGYYNDNYEAFTRISLDYFKKHHILAKLYWNGEQDIDLLMELQKGSLRPRSLKEIKRDRKSRARAEEIKKGR